MRKIVLSAIMGVFILAGTGLVLSAGETAQKDKEGSCCSSAMVLADASTVETAAISDCEGTKTAAASKADCSTPASASAETKAVPGECVKVPSGIRTSTAEIEKK